MVISTPRLGPPFLLHLLIWGVLITLLAMQPQDRTQGAEFIFVQTSMLFMLALVFYLNVGWAVPRLLYGRRVVPYLAFLVAAVLSILVVHWVLEENSYSQPQQEQQGSEPPQPGQHGSDFRPHGPPPITLSGNLAPAARCASTGLGYSTPLFLLPLCWR
ncbi:hypothetical protein [Hymenobacter sp. 5414T-23]|uniref:hypothetical protein n=1 Tax=Hymenobacter sp. 5414T-23 TaxID=2932252 RepID=UPI00293F754B|nr:hypothetical protein [Hymenobacter sp. 5414T-23]